METQNEEKDLNPIEIAKAINILLSAAGGGNQQEIKTTEMLVEGASPEFLKEIIKLLAPVVRGSLAILYMKQIEDSRKLEKVKVAEANPIE